MEEMDNVSQTPRVGASAALRAFLHTAPAPGGANGWQILLDAEDWTFLECDLAKLTSGAMDEATILKKLKETGGFWRYFSDEKLISGAMTTLGQHAAFAYILSGFTFVSSFLTQDSEPSTETIVVAFEAILVAAFALSFLSAMIASGTLGFLATFGDSTFVKLMFLRIKHTMQWPLFMNMLAGGLMIAAVILSFRPDLSQTRFIIAICLACIYPLAMIFGFWLFKTQRNVVTIMYGDIARFIVYCGRHNSEELRRLCKYM